MNHTPRQKELLEPPRIWKKSRKGSAIQFAPDQKTVRTGKKARWNNFIE
jgi:hypothetical protein